MSGPLPPRELLEPEALVDADHLNAAKYPGEAARFDSESLRSAAISLKRIADALGGDSPYALNTLMENAGQAFALGMRGR